MTAYAPIPKADQTAILSMTIPWRCYCGASFGVYDLSSLSDDPARVACETAAKAHRVTHRKVEK